MTDALGHDPRLGYTANFSRMTTKVRGLSPNCQTLTNAFGYNDALHLMPDRFCLEIMMRALIVTLIIGLTASAAAQGLSSSGDEPPALLPQAAERPVMVLPEISVRSGASSGERFERCVDVEIGASRSFNCLNQELQRHVDRINPNYNLPPVSARSADVRVGVVNMPAVRQQYGKNFGVSVVPFRPAPRVYTSPLARP